MSRTRIQKHASAMIQALVQRVEALSRQDHKLTRGELRDLFVSDILKPFLTSQFGLGAGKIINPKEEESHSVHIIIYDTRILPPFIERQKVGIYPAESVIATIDVHDWLRRKDLLEAEQSAKDMHERIYNPESGMDSSYSFLRPLCSVIGFYGTGIKELSETESGAQWLNSSIHHLFAICLVNRYTWLHESADMSGWSFQNKNAKTGAETVAFVTAILDNVRTHAEARFARLTYRHKDWLGMYVRTFSEGDPLSSP